MGQSLDDRAAVFAALGEPVRLALVDRLVTGPYRVVAERTAAVAPHVDAEAVATLMVGALVNYKVIEAVAGPEANAVSEERLVAAWAATYAAVIGGRVD